MPHLNISPLRRKPKVKIWRIIKAIIYRLKTGTQWRALPTVFFTNRTLFNWSSAFYYFNK